MKPLPEMSYKDLCRAIVEAWEEHNEFDIKRLDQYFKDCFGYYPRICDVYEWKKMLYEEAYDKTGPEFPEK